MTTTLDEQIDFAKRMYDEALRNSEEGCWKPDEVAQFFAIFDTLRSVKQAEPVAWVRFCSDGGIQGPILDHSMEDVRKKSGVWTPLYAAPQPAAAPVTWINGSPAKPHNQEWFIAETTYGDKVVLRALPDEFSYDFKTADETYIKADKVMRWMPFPDSDFSAPAAAPEGWVVTDAMVDAYHEASKGYFDDPLNWDKREARRIGLKAALAAAPAAPQSPGREG